VIVASGLANAGEATAQTPAASAKQVEAVAPAALPEPLTPDALRDLLVRRSDAEVRELLITQLDKEIGAAPAPDVDGYINEEAEAATLRENDDLPDIRQTKACDSTFRSVSELVGRVKRRVQ
jgi:hypothetical protein